MNPNHFLDARARGALAEAALAHAKDHGWAGVRMDQLARLAGRPAADFHPAAPSDAWDAIEEKFDRELAVLPMPDAPQARERLFELCMRRFEAMELHRAALAAIKRDEPLARGWAIAASWRSARWILGLAGLADGAFGVVRTGPMAALLMRARLAWEKDLEGDFARTLVCLDRDLRRAEEAQEFLDRLSARLRGRSPHSPDGQAQDGA